MFKHWPKAILAIVICELVGILSTPFTIEAIPTWYATLHKPFFSPPNWVFGPVWTILYALMGVSAFLVWEQGIKKKEIRLAMTFFVIQLILNFFWSLIFFYLKFTFVAFIEIIALWIMIFLCILTFRKHSTLAAYLLIPYLLWVSFAGALNLSIVLLN